MAIVDPNPNDTVTRADLNQQLEIHAKTIELQVLLSQQQEDILQKLSNCVDDHRKMNKALDILERRSWKQGWLFWGMIFSLITTAATLLSKASQ